MEETLVAFVPRAHEKNQALDPEVQKNSDPVNHPSHYTRGNIEVIDFIEDQGFDYHIGNAVKYLSRAGLKNDEIEDLNKAIWYIQRKINKIQKQRAVV